MSLIAAAAALDASRATPLRTQAFSQMPKVPAIDTSMEFPVLYQGKNYTIEGSLLAALFSKVTLGLDKVDNTSDLDKPISRATQEALDDLFTRLQEKATKADLDALIARVDVAEDKIAVLEEFMLNGQIPHARVTGFDDRVKELIAETPSITPTVVAGPNDW